MALNKGPSHLTFGIHQEPRTTLHTLFPQRPIESTGFNFDFGFTIGAQHSIGFQSICKTVGAPTHKNSSHQTRRHRDKMHDGN